MNTQNSQRPTAEEQSLCIENWKNVNGRVADACRKAGREPTSVRVVGVTKYVDTARTRALYNAGCRDLGESRPQALWEKAAAFAAADVGVRWHMIGHLQRNKVPKTMPYNPIFHTIDSVRLAEAMSRSATELSMECEGLIEVNLSEDVGRSGVLPDRLLDDASQILELPGVRIRGLMGMASHPEAGRNPQQEFANLRELRDGLSNRFPEAGGLPELSMGMSGDFQDAICEGSTIVRIGSALFHGLR
jgi:pyridoxal phosphate enzyme (YggS family)